MEAEIDQLVHRLYGLKEGEIKNEMSLASFFYAYQTTNQWGLATFIAMYAFLYDAYPEYYAK